MLNKKLQDLEREWEEVRCVPLEKQEHLVPVYRHIGQFHSHLGSLQSWMTKVLPVLDDSEPVHSDIFAIDDPELPSLKTEEENNFGHLSTFAIHLLPLGEESCWRWNHMKMNGVLS